MLESRLTDLLLDSKLTLVTDFSFFHQLLFNRDFGFNYSMYRVKHVITVVFILFHILDSFIILEVNSTASDKYYVSLK